MQDDRVAASLPHAVARLFRLVNRAHNRALAELGLTAEQAHVLSVLWALGAKTIGQLQQLLALSSPTLTGTIDRMEAIGLVRRRAAPHDGRAWQIEPHPHAARKRRAVEATVARAEEECFAGLTAGERRELLRLTAKATAAIEATPAVPQSKRPRRGLERRFHRNASST
jgi:DNA-binding MarR family transcriptional regulator